MKIEGVEVTRDDVDQLVTYVPSHVSARRNREVGRITSVTEHAVFVRYGEDTGSKATPPKLLRWGNHG